MVKMTTEQKNIITKMVKEGNTIQEIATTLVVDYGNVYYHAKKVAKQSPQEKAWETRRAIHELDYYNSLSAGKKAAYTRRVNKGLDPKPTPIAKVAVNGGELGRPRKAAVLESFTFNGTVKIDKELLKYLHRHPNGNEVTFAKTKLG
jgi:hypothetical protein